MSRAWKPKGSKELCEDDLFKTNHPVHSHEGEDENRSPNNASGTPRLQVCGYTDSPYWCSAQFKQSHKFQKLCCAGCIFYHQMHSVSVSLQLFFLAGFHLPYSAIDTQSQHVNWHKIFLEMKNRLHYVHVIALLLPGTCSV
jgi:hypothetical protein